MDKPTGTVVIVDVTDSVVGGQLFDVVVPIVLSQDRVTEEVVMTSGEVNEPIVLLNAVVRDVDVSMILLKD